ncbi:CIC11C00000001381 [Sungouiella intermedia]|uniref:CIC11C00000001381 n=1 Tax=Sungouiella intermedia TaxID=45354 RepID=A0A1L0C645_9ASCO|nr:CIC11C00000001381 [[Candida] intermedia]
MRQLKKSTTIANMPIFGEKPFTSITVKINQLCQPHRNDDLEDDSIELYVTDLIDLIKLQLTGAVEAARAVRKKIKYGNTVEEQLLALSLLELLVLNSGPKIGQVLASDDKLLDLLKNILSGNVRSGLGFDYDPQVAQKVKNLAIGWKSELADLDGYRGMAQLWKYIPRQLKQPRTGLSSRFDSEASSESRSPRRVRSDSVDERFNEYERASSRNRSNSNRKSPAPPRPTAASPYASKTSDNGDKKKKKKKSARGKKYADEEFEIPQINYKVEAPKIRNVIAECHTHTTALSNLLLALPAGSDPLSDDRIAKEFEKCRKVRRSVLRYLQYVGAGGEEGKSAEVVAMDEEFLGSLIVANEQLVTTFQQFDKASGYTAENPAPVYPEEGEEEESDESCYLSESDSELLTDGVGSMTVQESSSRLQEAVKSPPPRPFKSANLRPKTESEPKPLQRPPVAKTQSSGFVDSADPFGDSHEVGTSSSKYY